MSSIISFGLIFAACASSAFALSFNNLDLSTLICARNLLFAMGVLILGIAGYMYLSCPCCSGSNCSEGKKMKKKKHTDRAASSDSKRNSSTSSVRKSPRKSAIIN